MRRAETAVTRTVTRVLGIATLIFLGLAIGSIQSQFRLVGLAATIVYIALVFALPLAAAALSWVLSLDALRALLGATAAGYVAVMIAWVPLLDGTLELNNSPWILGVTALSTAAAALAWRPLFAWLQLVACSLLFIPVRYLSTHESNLNVAMQDAVYCLIFCSVFTALTIVSVRNGHRLDLADEAAREQVSHTAFTVAQSRERARLDALVHDEVMSTLLVASRQTDDDAQHIARQAQRAIAELDRLGRSDPQLRDEIASTEFLARLRSAVSHVSPGVSVTVAGTRAEPVPADVADAFTEAVGEAVRNAVTHGTGGAGCAVSARMHELGISVVIEDDGVGFEPAAVPAHRLGLVVSIHGRMSALAGGSSQLESSPGKGTVVALSWEDA